ncbi:hypothetical protein FAES_2674 [Fibrella aestuarina BUZ 2]|uniref:Lipoprotein n=1 Tax=Fibrella aestuarina BUZ 2 TaxID=1166018 RepID=I0K980_9BACT|nr:hypothetical protein [Fibrella aestuarina]CCH00683.1 hypothetical protein FAES_2674 [Fibrella aestuarina BUZ 2]
MKRFVPYCLLASLLCLWGCGPVFTTSGSRPNYPHDNGKHKGWYKHGRGLPPGQAKKRGW